MLFKLLSEFRELAGEIFDLTGELLHLFFQPGDAIRIGSPATGSFSGRRFYELFDVGFAR